jgi:glutaredoxin
MNNIITISRLFLMLTVFVFAPAQAEIYKWVDEQGKTHFSDVPVEGIKNETVELKINTYAAVEITPLLQRLGKDGKVIMYSAAWCGNCKMAEKYFRENSIPYTAYDVERSPTGRSDFKALRGTHVPVILIGKTRMNGFTASSFNRVYKLEMEKLAPAEPPAPVASPVE